MKTLTHLKEEHKRDINIEITSLNGVLEEIKKETANKQNVSVLLYSGHYKAKVLVDYVNSVWSSEFFKYIKDNNIRIEDVVCITPYNEVEFEEAKKVLVK